MSKFHTVTGSFSCPVYYEDTDFTGFVYHANYLKFFERAREHAIGIDRLKDLYDNHDLHFVVYHADLSFLQPAKHGDALTIRTEITFSRSPLIIAKQVAFLENAIPGDVRAEKPIATLTIDLVAVNRAGKPTRIPRHLLAVL